MSQTPTVETHTISTFAYLDFTILATIFMVPLVFSGPQLVVGTIVNACLFLAAENWPVKKLIPLAILPSIGAILHGVVLGAFTPLLLYMAPFIWISNLILMLSYQYLRTKSVGIGVGLAAGVKALFLFSIAWLLVGSHVLPAVFLTSMGALQLASALLGGSLVAFLNKIIQR